MLSNREWVQPVSSVDYYGEDFMAAVQNRTFPRFAGGGQAVQNMAENLVWGTAGLNYQAGATAVNVIVPGTAPVIPKYVPPVVSAAAGAPSVAGLRGSRAANEALMQGIFASQFGWTGPEWAATQYLMMRESGFNNVAQNPTSTAFGQFQFLDSTWGGYGIPKTANSALQDVAGGRYIKARYHDPLGAAAHEQAFNWYAYGGQAVPVVSRDNGGPIEQGYTLVWNGTGGAENVRTAEQEDQILQAIGALSSRPPAQVTVNQDNRGHQWSPEEVAASNARHMSAALQGVSL
jgi:hypothetical protein